MLRTFLAVATAFSFLGCAVKKANVSPPLFYDTEVTRVGSLPTKKDAVFLYVEIRDDVKEDTLRQIAALTEPLEVTKSPSDSVRRMLKETYGTSSGKFRRIFADTSSQPSTGGTAGQGQKVTFFGGPVFSDSLTSLRNPKTQTEESSPYPYSFGNAYLKIKDASAGDLTGIKRQLAGILAKDPAVRQLTLTSTSNLVGDDDCEEYSNLESPPYDSLAGWNLPSDYKEKYQDVRVAVIDGGLALRDGVANTKPPVDLDSSDFDPRIPLWANDESRSLVKLRTKSDTLCKDDKFGCNIPERNGAVEEILEKNKWFGHGTHVAGLSSGFSTEKLPIPRDKIHIMVVKIMDREGKIDSSWLSSAIGYAIRHKAKVVNMSLIGPPEVDVNTMYDFAEQREVLLVAAAGNGDIGKEGDLLDPNEEDLSHYPAMLASKYDNLITVSALAGRDQPEPAKFSNYGPEIVTIAAPGVRVESTVPGDGKRAKRCGTSQATPLVSLTAAMLFMQNPSFTPAKVKRRIQLSADYVPSLASKVQFGGKLNMRKALSWDKDLVETKDHQLCFGDIVKNGFLNTSDGAYPLDWADIGRIDFGIQGKDRIIWLNGENRLTPRTGTLMLNSVRLNNSTCNQTTFNRDQIRDIVMRMR
jgi:subtilisin family serine protease